MIIALTAILIVKRIPSNTARRLDLLDIQGAGTARLSMTCALMAQSRYAVWSTLKKRLGDGHIKSMRDDSRIYRNVIKADDGPRTPAATVTRPSLSFGDIRFVTTHVDR
jgi:hypothetical protein